MNIDLLVRTGQQVFVENIENLARIRLLKGGQGLQVISQLHKLL